MHIERFVCNPFQENCYVVSAFSAEEDACIIVDCGAYYEEETAAILRYIDGRHLRPVAHLLTHAHLDHLFGARFIWKTYGLLPTLSTADEPLFRSVEEQARLFGIPLRQAPMDAFMPIPEDALLPDGMLMVAGVRIGVMPSPGHTPGSVCYRLPGSLCNLFPCTDEKAVHADVLFSGDTLFCQGYGRTDLPGGDYGQLMASLAKLFRLPENTIVLSGHGVETTIGEEHS